MRCKTFIPQNRLGPVFRPVFLLINILTLTIFAIGCSTAPQQAPVSRDEATAVRARIDRAINGQDAASLSALIDENEFSRRIAEHAKSVSERIIRNSISQDKAMGQLFEQMIAAVRAGRSLKFVKAYEANKSWHLVYRMFGDGLNYFDWELIRAGKEVKVADIFIYVTGENLSQTVGATLDPAAGISGELQRSMLPELKRLRSHMNNGEFEDAARIFDSWPANVKQHRMLRIIHTQILAGLGKEDEYIRELEKIAVDFPDSRNVPLLMIDVYLLRKNYDKALESINRLDKFVGGDPFLEFYRAQLAQERGDKKRYQELVRKAFASEKDIDALTIEMMYVSILTGDSAGLKTAEDAFRNSRNYDPGVVSRLQELAKEPATAEQ